MSTYAQNTYDVTVETDVSGMRVYTVNANRVTVNDGIVFFLSPSGDVVALFMQRHVVCVQKQPTASLASQP